MKVDWAELNYSGGGSISVPVADIVGSEMVQAQVAACQEIRDAVQKAR